MVAQISLQTGAQVLGDVTLTPSNPRSDTPNTARTWKWPYTPPHGEPASGWWRWVKYSGAPDERKGRYVMQLIFGEKNDSPFTDAVSNLIPFVWLYSRYWTIGGEAPFGPWFSEEDGLTTFGFGGGATSGIGSYYKPVEKRESVVKKGEFYRAPLTGSVDFHWTTTSVSKSMNPFDGSDPPRGGTVGVPSRGSSRR